MAGAKKIAKIGEKLKFLRISRGISRRKAAIAAGISYDYLAKIENGQRSPNIARLEAVAKVLGTQLADLFSGPSSADFAPFKSFPLKEWGLIPLGEGVPVPRIGWARAGSWDEASDSGFEPGAADDWLYSDHGGGRVFALRVEGDSMAPEFIEGEFILVDPDREAMAGDYVIAKIEGAGEATFKQLKYRDGRPVLHPLNPNYADIEIPDSNNRNLGTRNEDMSPDFSNDLRIVGVVVEKKTIFGVNDAREAKIRAIAGRVQGLDNFDLDRVAAALDLLFPEKR